MSPSVALRTGSSHRQRRAADDVRLDCPQAWRAIDDLIGATIKDDVLPRGVQLPKARVMQSPRPDAGPRSAGALSSCARTPLPPRPASALHAMRSKAVSRCEALPQSRCASALSRCTASTSRPRCSVESETLRRSLESRAVADPQVPGAPNVSGAGLFACRDSRLAAALSSHASQRRAMAEHRREHESTVRAQHREAARRRGEKLLQFCRPREHKSPVAEPAGPEKPATPPLEPEVPGVRRMSARVPTSPPATCRALPSLPAAAPFGLQASPRGSEGALYDHGQVQTPGEVFIMFEPQSCPSPPSQRRSCPSGAVRLAARLKRLEQLGARRRLERKLAAIERSPDAQLGAALAEPETSLSDAASDAYTEEFPSDGEKSDAEVSWHSKAGDIPLSAGSPDGSCSDGIRRTCSSSDAYRRSPGCSRSRSSSGRHTRSRTCSRSSSRSRSCSRSSSRSGSQRDSSRSNSRSNSRRSSRSSSRASSRGCHNDSHKSSRDDISDRGQRASRASNHRDCHPRSDSLTIEGADSF